MKKPNRFIRSTTPPALANTVASAMTSRVDIRMYCMGTGDCFVLKFYTVEQLQFTMMIDCGSCFGGAKAFTPYVQNLAEWVNHTIDLLVVTHEHNDHVNGFAKCRAIFENITIKQAWFAWTENPADPDGKAKDLLKKREKMRLGFQKALTKVSETRVRIEKELKNDFYGRPAASALSSLFDGLQTLGTINLNEDESSGAPLAGMTAIKEVLAAQKTPIRYLGPGMSIDLPPLPGVKFHVLGPPLDKKYIYKDGKEGKDVFKRHFSVGEGILAMNTFASLGTPPTEAELPFGAEYVLEPSDWTNSHRRFRLRALAKTMGVEAETDEIIPNYVEKYLRSTSELLYSYNNLDNKWRTIENEWLYTAGSLAIRLNSHINNTSLALAVEFGTDGKVLLLPGDAEYGSWESWHMIDNWKSSGKDKKPFAEDLLNRTVFYKVGHHLSFNGTALEKGIMMMNSPDLTSMVTLDRNRISSKWKTTMPNKPLLSELIKRCQGRCFIMDETEIENPPSVELDPLTLGAQRYINEKSIDGKTILAKQYSVLI
jgi:hypothetical protein